MHGMAFVKGTNMKRTFKHKLNKKSKFSPRLLENCIAHAKEESKHSVQRVGIPYMLIGSLLESLSPYDKNQFVFKDGTRVQFENTTEIEVVLPNRQRFYYQFENIEVPRSWEVVSDLAHKFLT